MKPFPVPVVAIGPGSQPDEEPLNYIASPGEMAVFKRPTPRAPASAEAMAGARALLGQLLARMAAGTGATQRAQLSLLDADPEVIVEVNELLGHGEVSVLLAAPWSAHIQESAFPGIWRTQVYGAGGALVLDEAEAGPIPRIVSEALAGLPAPTAPAREPGPEVMNAPALLAELRAASAACRPGADAHIINLTLLPVTPEDLEWLAGELGWGPVTILSRGYGNCRITATALPNTWWVQYFNSTDQLILNTIEVVEVPVAALAADEDILESMGRLSEWLGTLQ
jgi:hydrogenase-1 operon protein HyaF